MAEELTKGPDEIYCPECGRTIKRGTVICPYCKVNIKELFGVGEINEMPTYRVEPGITPKSKTVAVVLAIFFGFWAWLYTYGKNKLKFWIVLGISTIMFIVVLSYSCSLVADAVTYDEYNIGDIGYLGNSFIGLGIFMNLLSFGIWVWAIVDNAIRPNNFYERYPKG